MDLKRFVIYAAIVAVMSFSPVMADDWESMRYATVANEGDYNNYYPGAAEDSGGLDIGGWLSSGIYSNQYGAKYNGPLTMRGYGDGYTVDQMWLYAEKAADNGGSGLAFGGRVDFIWGADGPDTQCFGDGGWDGDWFTSNDYNYGSALPQLYGEMAYNDFKVKIGHFYTIIGYEVVPAPDNFFYSHSYALAIEPFTHMGVLGEYGASDNWTFYGGWTNGWDNGWLNPTHASTFLGGVSTTLNDKLTVTYATSFGDLYNWEVVQGLANEQVTTYMHSLVFDWQLTCRLNYILQSDFRTDKSEGGGVDPYGVKFYGVNQYLLYCLNDNWSIGTRVEWFRGEFHSGLVSESFSATGATFGVNYKPTENIVVRPEIRWDSWNGDPQALSYVFDNFSRSSQFSGGFDCIIMF